MKNLKKQAVIIGNSDGIGLELTKNLLEKEWEISGISRSSSPIQHNNYMHTVLNVEAGEYPGTLKELIAENRDIEMVVYCAGTGKRLDLSNMDHEKKVFEVNLMGMIKTAEIIIPYFVNNKKGHFIGLSSQADEMLSEEAPSYHASKAGFSNYLEGLALAAAKQGVSVTNIRFGFVDTKMAKGDVKPFMMSARKSVDHILKCIEKKPVRYTAPKIVIPLVKFRRYLLRLNVLLKSLF
ncbi:MAG: SDR family NAD(P)-dependent oxidoreductase [Elusimicrobiota bacterium]